MNIYKKIIRINSYLYPFLFCIALLILFLSMHLKNGSTQFILHYSRLILYVTLASTCLVSLDDNEFLFLKKISRYLLVLSLVYLLTAVLYNAVSPNNLPWYIIHPNDFVYMPILISFIYLPGAFNRYMNKTKNITFHNSYPLIKNLAIIGIFVLLYLATVKNFVHLFTNATYNITWISTHLNNSYDDKMKYGWGDFYTYMKMVKNMTSENAVILHPPQKNPWQEEGNQLLLRYFLYPRTLISSSDLNKLKSPKVDYILLTWGNSKYPPGKGESYGWPKEKVNSKRVYYFNLKNETLMTVEGQYDPGNGLNIGGWGLIQL